MKEKIYDYRGNVEAVAGISSSILTNIICFGIFILHLVEKPGMKQIKLSTNFAVFLLFFGVATLEAFQTHNWIKAVFWLAIGFVFLMADNTPTRRP